MRIAIERNGKIENIVAVPDGWTGADGEWRLPEGATVVEHGPGVEVGATWDGARWVPPPPPAAAAPTNDTRIRKLEAALIAKGALTAAEIDDAEPRVRSPQP